MLFKVGQLVDNPNCTLQFLSFEKPTLFPLKRNGENKKVYTYNVFVITDFFLQKIVFKKERIEMKRDGDAVQVPVVCSESLSLEASEDICSAHVCCYSDL